MTMQITLLSIGSRLASLTYMISGFIQMSNLMGVDDTYLSHRFAKVSSSGVAALASRQALGDEAVLLEKR